MTTLIHDGLLSLMRLLKACGLSDTGSQRRSQALDGLLPPMSAALELAPTRGDAPARLLQYGFVRHLAVIMAADGGTEMQDLAPGSSLPRRRTAGLAKPLRDAGEAPMGSLDGDWEETTGESRERHGK
jgi:hypothetical protein